MELYTFDGNVSYIAYLWWKFGSFLRIGSFEQFENDSMSQRNKHYRILQARDSVQFIAGSMDLV